ncbi:MAG: hypothetical protein ABSC22_13530 [Roseiarcus sp.]
MNWDHVEVGWIQLKHEIVLRWDKLSDDNGKRVELIGAPISSDGQSSDAQMIAFRPDNPGMRGELSRRIGR